MADVFVSYSRKDIDFVRTLVGALVERGKEVWVDWEGIPPTVEFMEEIRAAVESADAFLFVLSPDSATSRVCNEELDGAVALNKRIIPVVRRDVPEADVPEEVAGLNWIFCRESDDVGQQVGLLLEALDTDYDWVRAHTRLLVRASEWDRKGQESSLLLRGKDLVEAEEQVARPDRKPEPTELQHSFVLASRRASARSQRLRLVAVTVALVVALILAGLALVQRQTAQEQRERAEDEATTARSRQLAAQADSQLDVDPELSTLLALESIDVKETDEAKDVLRESITEANVVATLQGHDGPVVDVAVAERDGQPTVVTAGEDGTVRFWDPETGEQQDELQAHEGGVYTIDVSSEHGLLATSGADMVARTWDLDSLDGIAEIGAQVGNQPYDVAIDPSGERLATAGFDGTVAIWDLQARERTMTYRDHQAGTTASPVRAVAWTPDGRRVVSAGSDQLVKVWQPDTGVTSITYEDHPRLRVPGGHHQPRGLARRGAGCLVQRGRDPGLGHQRRAADHHGRAAGRRCGAGGVQPRRERALHWRLRRGRPALVHAVACRGGPVPRDTAATCERSPGPPTASGWSPPASTGPRRSGPRGREIRLPPLDPSREVTYVVPG